MLSIEAKIRKDFGKKVKQLRQKGALPGVLYGPQSKNLALELDLKGFSKVYKSAGRSSLISLEVEGKKSPVLIHELKKDPLTEQIIHVDFYQPNLKEEIEVTVPLVFEGEAPATKELGGTLVRNIHEVEVKALPENLPHELKVDVSQLKTFEDAVKVKDLVLSKGVKIQRNQKDIIAFVASPEKVEEELEKPIEEKVEEVEKVEKKEKEEVSDEAKEGETETKAK